MRRSALRESGRGVAVGEFAHRDFVGLGLRMNERRGFFARGARIDDRFERRVFDRHQLGGVFGDIAALGDDQRHRLADIAHPLDRKRPLLHRRFHRGEKRLRQFAHIFAGDDGPDAVVRKRGARVDRNDVGMGMRRADDVGVQGADRHRQIVGIAAAARQQRRVFLAERFCRAFGHRYSRWLGSMPNSAWPAPSKLDRCAWPCAVTVCISRKRRSNGLPLKIASAPAA